MAYRPEYPRPQLVRKDWINLNGAWEYRTDRALSGTERKFFAASTEFPETIEVPFCRESVLSGIGDTDFCGSVWYRKQLTLPKEWDKKRVILHVGACDYETTLWVNEKEVGTHRGGYAAFSFDITPYVVDGKANVVLRVLDDLRSQRQPAGKQSHRYASYGCSYTRTTGIWQTVWLEAVAPSYITGTKFYPDIDAGTLTVVATAENADGRTLAAEASYEGRPMGSASAVVQGRQAVLTIPLSELHLWEVGHGRLYDLTLTLGEDCATSYFGMRSISVRDGILYLNRKPVFQRLVLDQGFYPDGIYTASSDAELLADVERSMAVGFNGARLHQKVFEPRFLYHCDRLGYIVWEEHANWELNIHAPEAWRGFIPEWLEILERDFNHPSIIGWCPLNETQMDQDPEFVRYLSDLTRSYDPTRLYIEASGWEHIPGCADILDVHDYNQDPAAFAATYEPTARGEDILINSPRTWRKKGDPERGQPTFVSEYGGILWVKETNEGGSWGYGNGPKTEEEFLARFKGLTEAILFHPRMGGLCYTQLTDVEQEQNGLYTYHREAKFDPAVLHAILSQKAAIEEE